MALNHEYPPGAKAEKTRVKSQAVSESSMEQSKSAHGEASEVSRWLFSGFGPKVGAALRKTGSAGVAIVAGFSTVIGSSAIAAPTDDDIANAKAHEQSVESSVSDIESQLASVNADLDKVHLERDLAEIDYEDAQSRVVIAEEDQQKAQKDAKDAKEKLDAARKDLGTVARTAYTSQGSLSDLAVFVKDDGLRSASTRDMAVSHLGRKNQHKVDVYTDRKAQADSAVKAADEAVETQRQASKEAEERYQEMQSTVEKTEREAAELESQRDALINDLAKARGVTVELEQERQADIERQKQEAEAARQKAALEQAEAEAKAQAEADAKAKAEAKPKEKTGA
ncbi:MAG: hypothetical protein Q4P66_06940, partial [Actinomycetaceae bacterium]|nr:hypothetical protein [Actinomycetaceae bacterium]